MQVLMQGNQSQGNGNPNRSITNTASEVKRRRAAVFPETKDQKRKKENIDHSVKDGESGSLIKVELYKWNQFLMVQTVLQSETLLFKLFRS